ncbi:pyrophosphatase PpaX [Melghirimyces algeriensis]|uniref:Pyrophosphatase PpaX n=1 Tax=Melghirimyces algeriensis TaxID=910412 RepID=A0A521D1E5_9BACL|nr:pyrophosphatase PpaX [Melghirimyces algeriensis]SMO65498.1 pyrophosphatase PpaX [Melghirimyces algeriensis]
MRYRTVLFDLDGTILDTTPLIVASFQHTWKTYGLDQYSEQDVFHRLGEPLWDQMRHFGGPERADRMVATYRAYNMANHDRYVQTFPGVDQVLEKLYREGLLLGIVSNKQRQAVQKGLKQSQLSAWFSTVVCWEDADRPKPDPSPIRLALERLDGDAKTTLMVGDSKYDLLAARQAGVASAAVSWSVHGTSLFRYRPDHVLDTMEDLLQVVGLPPSGGGESS